MNKLMTHTLVLALTLATAATAQAAVVFTGDGSPADAGFTFDAAGGSGNVGDSFEFDTECSNPSTCAAQPGIMHEIQNTSGAGRWQLNDLSELNRAAGWFVETNIQILSHSDPGGLLLIRDDVGGVVINLKTSQFEIGGVNVGIGSGYNKLRLVMAAGGSSIDITVNDISAGSVTATPAGGAEFNFSDGNSSRGLDANWDYVAINGEIPEPATLSLLGLGATLLLRRRR